MSLASSDIKLLNYVHNVNEYIPARKTAKFILVIDFINIPYEIKFHHVQECLKTLQENGVGSRGIKPDSQMLLIRAG